MTLLELCEPLFQYICRLNRSARKGGHHIPTQVREEIKGLLADIRNKARSDPALAAQLDQGGMYLVLLFFVDFMVRNSKLPFASDWPNLAYEQQEMGGDEKFFDMLDAALADRTDAATERIAVYFTCMGLGFTGFYTGQPEYLRRKMLECSARLRGLINADESARVCPEAYNPDRTILFKPIGASLVGITVTLIVLVLAVFALNIYMYNAASREMRQALVDLQHSKLAGEPVATSSR